MPGALDGTSGISLGGVSFFTTAGAFEGAFWNLDDVDLGPLGTFGVGSFPCLSVTADIKVRTNWAYGQPQCSLCTYLKAF